MTVPTAQARTSFDARDVALAFVAARRAARSLQGFPGALPGDLAQAYAVQEAAIGLWPDTVAGWKVGAIPRELQAELQAERVIGPVFHANVWTAGPEPTPLPVIAGGFAAVEAEYVYRIGRDAPAGKLDWTPEESLDYVERMFVGVEFAGSPLATINVLGPRAVASDFGNNAGLVLGPTVPDWRRTDDWPPCEAYVDDRFAGRGSPASLAGGPPGALAFLMSACAGRGRPLKAGQLVTTGAASGIHDIEAGQTARIAFGGLGEIRCVAQRAQAEGSPGGSDHGQRDVHHG